MEEKKAMLVFNIHHIISDGWSMAIFVKELLISYDKILKGANPVFKVLKKNYRDHVEEEKKAVSSGKMSLYARLKKHIKAMK